LPEPAGSCPPARFGEDQVKKSGKNSFRRGMASNAAQ
jgi:hypothetical protein